MNKWSTLQIRAWKSYIQQEEKDITRYKNGIDCLKEKIINYESLLENSYKRVNRMESELIEQGWKLESGEWVRVDDTKQKSS